MGVPTWMYRRAEDGSVESRVFDSDAIPEGWADSPDKCNVIPAAPDSPRPPKRKGKRRV